MALTSLRQILDHDAEHGYGMPALRITNLETLLAVMRAAVKRIARSSSKCESAR